MNNMKRLWLWSLTLLLPMMPLLAQIESGKPGQKVLTGLDVLVQDDFFPLKGKRVGIITNHTAVNRDGVHIVTLFHQTDNVQLAALFGPEHGIQGQTEAGVEINTARDGEKGIPVYSLYGAALKPTPEMLTGLEALVFDIQDVGARFYTYISTMSKAMEAAAEQGIPFFVLDRPNPIAGLGVEGPVLQLPYRSFVGIHPIALRHGMTIGELARMFNGEGWLENGRVQLTVIPMHNWRRQDFFPATGLSWIRPSPNIPRPETALLYPGICLLEATNVSEGRGTQFPFEFIGAPWIKAVELADYLNRQQLPGITIEPIQFTPVDLPDMATNPKFKDQLCQGLKLSVTDPVRFRSVAFGVHLLAALQTLYPDKFVMHEERMDRLAGTGQLYRDLKQARLPADIIAAGQDELSTFIKMREKYLLY